MKWSYKYSKLEEIKVTIENHDLHKIVEDHLVKHNLFKIRDGIKPIISYEVFEGGTDIDTNEYCPPKIEVLISFKEEDKNEHLG